MEQQNFKTHKRLIFGYHGFTALAIFALIVGSIMNLINSAKDNYYSASLLVLISVVMLFMWFYIRSFALKAQDRAINAEESLRAFILSGKPMNNNLTIRQVIGLRFASDDEYVALADRAVKEKLSENGIKKAIQNWKPDTYRV
tara:strand:+ start:10095 stop:10523 length:429 start_codon:yes stop_codon:yes gene_type:complete